MKDPKLMSFSELMDEMGKCVQKHKELTGELNLSYKGQGECYCCKKWFPCEDMIETQGLYACESCEKSLREFTVAQDDFIHERQDLEV